METLNHFVGMNYPFIGVQKVEDVAVREKPYAHHDGHGDRKTAGNFLADAHDGTSRNPASESPSMIRRGSWSNAAPFSTSRAFSVTPRKIDRAAGVTDRGPSSISSFRKRRTSKTASARMPNSLRSS